MNKGNITRYSSEYHTNDVYAINAGKQDKTDHSFGPFTWKYYVMQYVVDGEGTFVCNGKTFHIAKGDMFLLPKNVSVKYWADEKSPYMYYWIAFDGNYVSRLLKLCNLSAETPIVHIKNKSVEKCFVQIFQLLKNRTNYNNVGVLSLIYRIFELIIRQLPQKEITYEDTPVVQKVVDVFKTNISNPITLNELYKKVGFGRSYIYVLFKNEYGISPKEYLTQLRMNYAAELLQNTNITIFNVASNVGMNQAQFIKMFKKAFDCTPTEYRKRLSAPKVITNITGVPDESAPQ